MTKIEKIIEIKEVEDVKVGKYGYECDGFEIVTNKQSIKLLIENGQYCCENAGYFMSEDDFSKFIGAKLIDITITDDCLNTKKFNEELKYGVDSGDCMFVNINTNKGTLQFTAYNEHNGYYGHSAYVISEQLNHECGL